MTRIDPLPPQLEDLMTKARFAYICTVGSSNQPHVTPVFFVYSWEDSSIYLITSSKSKKMTNIRSNRRVAITIDIRDPVDPQNNLGVLVRGKAETIGSLTTAGQRGEWETRLYSSFKDKYKEFERWLSDYRGRTGLESIVWVKIRPTKMTWWRLWRFKTLKFPEQAHAVSWARPSERPFTPTPDGKDVFLSS